MCVSMYICLIGRMAWHTLGVVDATTHTGRGGVLLRPGWSGCIPSPIFYKISRLSYHTINPPKINISHERFEVYIELMEKPIDQNPMPEFHILAPRINPLELVAHGLVRAFHFMFDHHHRPQGADAMLMGEQDGHER